VPFTYWGETILTYSFGFQTGGVGSFPILLHLAIYDQNMNYVWSQQLAEKYFTPNVTTTNLIMSISSIGLTYGGLYNVVFYERMSALGGSTWSSYSTWHPNMILTN
jgi:hypothetical protein